MNDLELYREQLAECDDRIIDALVERNSIIEKIMAYKEEYGIPILQPQQEKKQQRQIKEKLQDNRYEKEIEDVFHCIVRNSKRIQAQKIILLQHYPDWVYGGRKKYGITVFKKMYLPCMWLRWIN